MKNKMLNKIKDWLLVAGGITWGLVVVKCNPIQWLEDKIGITWSAELVYILVFVAALIKGYELITKK